MSDLKKKPDVCITIVFCFVETDVPSPLYYRRSGGFNNSTAVVYLEVALSKSSTGMSFSLLDSAEVYINMTQTTFLKKTVICP